MSASPRHSTMLCHSVTSFLSPVVLSLYVSDVAMVKFATDAPFSRLRTSGSLPKRPTRMTLFTPDISKHFRFQIIDSAPATIPANFLLQQNQNYTFSRPV